MSCAPYAGRPPFGLYCKRGGALAVRARKRGAGYDAVPHGNAANPRAEREAARRLANARECALRLLASPSCSAFAVPRSPSTSRRAPFPPHTDTPPIRLTPHRYVLLHKIRTRTRTHRHCRICTWLMGPACPMPTVVLLRCMLHAACHALYDDSVPVDEGLDFWDSKPGSGFAISRGVRGPPRSFRVAHAAQ